MTTNRFVWEPDQIEVEEPDLRSRQETIKKRLEPGCSKDVISRNIAELMRSGKHKKDQAVAIAYENCRRGKNYGAQRPISWLERKLKGYKLEPGLKIERAADGLRRMVVISSNSFRDREKEWLTSESLQEYVDKSWKGDDVFDNGNVGLLWHDDDMLLGPIVWADVEGPFLIEVIKEAPAGSVVWHQDMAYPVSAVWDYVEQDRQEKWGASIGFGVELKQVDVANEETTYQHIEKRETSILPLKYAANPYTFAGVIDKAMDEKRNELFDRIFGRAGAAKTMRSGIKDLTDELGKRGLVHKGLSDEKVVKGLIENIGSAIDGVLGKLFDSPPVDLKDQIMQVIVASLGNMPDTQAPEAPPATEGEMGGMGMGDMGQKQLKLLDDLISTQEGLTADQKALAESIQALTPLLELSTKYESVTKEIKEFKTVLEGVQKQLSGRPRAASQASETVVTDKDLVDAVRKNLQTTDPVFGKVNPLPTGGAGD